MNSPGSVPRVVPVVEPGETCRACGGSGGLGAGVSVECFAGALFFCLGCGEQVARGLDAALVKGQLGLELAR